MSDVQLPQAKLSEQFLLACVINNPERLPQLASLVPETFMFFDVFYRTVYESLREQASQGMQPDIGTLFSALPDDTVALAEITTTLPEGLWLDARLRQRQMEAHAELVADAYVRREATLALSRGERAEEVLEKLNGFTSKGQDRLFTADQVADLVYAELTQAQDRVSFPFAELNRATSGGIRRGEMAIVAARQGIGKSTWLQNVTLHAVKGGKRVLFVSAEMGSVDLGGRWVTILSGQQILRQTEPRDQDALTAAIAKLHEWQERLLVQELVNVAGIEQTLREHEGKIDLVCVDYLQKLSPINPKTRSEYERVSEVSRTLDNLCQRYQVPMLVAAQFNRRAENNQPSIADLRDSGQIEADADLVIALWAKPEEQADASRSRVRMDILKNRNGYTFVNTPTHEHALWFDKPRFTFGDIEGQRSAPDEAEAAESDHLVTMTEDIFGVKAA